MTDTIRDELNRLLDELTKAHYAGKNRREEEISRLIERTIDRIPESEVPRHA